MRNQIETFLEELGHFAFRRAWPIISVVAAVLILLVTQIHKIEVRTSIDEFLESDDPTRIVYDTFLTQFGRDDVILIAVEPPEVFDFAFLDEYYSSAPDALLGTDVARRYREAERSAESAAAHRVTIIGITGNAGEAEHDARAAATPLLALSRDRPTQIELVRCFSLVASLARPYAIRRSWRTCACCC